MPQNNDVPEVRRRFAARLKQLRIERGYPHASALAVELGVDEGRYGQYERAETEPSLTVLHKLCQVLQVSADNLLDFPDPKPTEAHA